LPDGPGLAKGVQSFFTTLKQGNLTASELSSRLRNNPYALEDKDLIAVLIFLSKERRLIGKPEYPAINEIQHDTGIKTND